MVTTDAQTAALARLLDSGIDLERLANLASLMQPTFTPELVEVERVEKVSLSRADASPVGSVAVAVRGTEVRRVEGAAFVCVDDVPDIPSLPELHRPATVHARHMFATLQACGHDRANDSTDAVPLGAAMVTTHALGLRSVCL